MNKGSANKATPDKIGGPDKLNGHCHRGSNSVDGTPNITSMEINEKDGRFELGTEANNRRKDLESDRRKGMVVGKEGRFDRISMGKKPKYNKVSNIASTSAASPLKTPTKSPSPSIGGTDGKLSKMSVSDTERGSIIR